MGFRIRRSVRLAPGLRVNLSRGGASLSLGGHGLTANIGRRGARTTVALPGTGLSYSTRIAGGRRRPARVGAAVFVLAALVVAALVFG